MRYSAQYHHKLCDTVHNIITNYVIQCTISSQMCYTLFYKKEKLYNKNIICIFCGSSIWHIICNTKAHYLYTFIHVGSNRKHWCLYRYALLPIDTSVSQ